MKVLPVQSPCLEMFMYSLMAEFISSGLSHLKVFLSVSSSVTIFNGERTLKGVFFPITLKISLIPEMAVF